jgi:6-pyruvoyl-tetrahydropterin synthase related domain
MPGARKLERATFGSSILDAPNPREREAVLSEATTNFSNATNTGNSMLQSLSPEARASWRVALLCVSIASTLVITPMFFLGNVSGHDIAFHLSSWMDVAGQWREGILYPRWAEWANFGFGEPRFVFYPPASWMAGAALGSLLPWRMVPGAFVWLALIVSGMAMWKLAREWLPGRQAIVAALLYTVNPYHLVIVYYRSDFAELMADALFPLLVWASLLVIRREWKKLPALAIVFGGIWLSNAPAAVIATYSLGLIFVVACAVRRSLRPLLPGLVAMGAGLALVAFYIGPAKWEQRWVQISQALSDSGYPTENFLFMRSNDPAAMAFNGKVSWVAVGMIFVTVIAATLGGLRRRDFRIIWSIIASLAAASVWMMLPASAWLWRVLPELPFLQFPWRWLELLAIACAFFVAAAMNQAPERHPSGISWLVVVLLFAALGGAATAMIENAIWDTGDVSSMADAIRGGHGYEGTNEYAPIAVDRLELPGNPDADERPDGVSPDPAPPIGELDPASGEIVAASGVRVAREIWSAERKVFTADNGTPFTLALRLAEYPAWNFKVDGRTVAPGVHPETGQILISLGSGFHRVEARFLRTWDRTMGGLISALTALTLLGVSWRHRRGRP